MHLSPQHLDRGDPISGALREPVLEVVTRVVEATDGHRGLDHDSIVPAPCLRLLA